LVRAVAFFQVGNERDVAVVIDKTHPAEVFGNDDPRRE
jgi:hypothetical protein